MAAATSAVGKGNYRNKKKVPRIMKIDVILIGYDVIV
jgi:hypothetical protein